MLSRFSCCTVRPQIGRIEPIIDFHQRQATSRGEDSAGRILVSGSERNRIRMFMLKALHHGVNRRAHPVVEAARGFWLAYDGPADLGRSIRHTGGVMIARLYGKSPVEYLVDESSRRRALRIGALALGGEINSVESLLGLLEDDERTER